MGAVCNRYCNNMGTLWPGLALLVLMFVSSSYEHSFIENEADQIHLLRSLNAQLQQLKNGEKPEKKEEVDEMTKIKNILGALTKQIMMAQLVREESIRSEGQSGVKQVRVGSSGTAPYFTAHHMNGRSYMSIHDHSQNARTQGMGEMVVILNGVEFRTRHNDYQLNMQSKDPDDKFGKTQMVPFPDVPPAVLNAGSVENQIKEMREWFKAWR